MLEDLATWEKVGAAIAGLLVAAWGVIKGLRVAFGPDKELQTLQSIAAGVDELRAMTSADDTADEINRILDVAESHNERIGELERTAVAHREQIRGISRRLDLQEERRRS